MDGTVALAITRRVGPAALPGSFISWNMRKQCEWVKATKPGSIMHLQQNVFGARLPLLHLLGFKVNR